jgi:hydroxymethylpyrimidine/phosphomethylpyrimidine kinase
MKGRILVIAGSDSGGGAGIQADIKTITALGGYAMTAVTALTAQNTVGVFGILPVAPDFVALQIEKVLDDLGADCLKTGMLHDAAIIATVAECHARLAPRTPLVVDPVMVATSGAALIDPGAIDALTRHLISRASVVTPNIPEAELLVGFSIQGLDDMRRAADHLLRLGAKAAVVKGGHLTGDRLYDLIVDGRTSHVIEAQRLATRSTHGTGCTFAAAIATGLAQGLGLFPAVDRAHAYVQAAIRSAPGYGRGHGPLDHGHAMLDGTITI